MNNLLIDFWKTEAVAGPEPKGLEQILVRSEDLGAFNSALGADAGLISAGDKVSFTDDNKLIVTGSDGMPKGAPITLNAGAQTTLRSFEELADLQGQIKPEESVAISQADIDALEVELGESSGLTDGQKVVFEGDKLVILDANDMVAETITLSAGEQTALQSLDARADLQAQIKPEESVAISQQTLMLLK